MRKNEQGLRVLQIIDSLRPGGAEKMAVNIANTLVGRIGGSFLCCTRIEGLLLENLSPEVDYIFLKKKNTFDPKALKKLRRFAMEHHVNLIHAHGTSFFLALQLKISLPGVKLVWHDHLGARALENRHPGILKPASLFFDGVLTANEALRKWAVQNLYCNKIKKINNFFSNATFLNPIAEVKGGSSFKIICVANLRREKDHLNLLKAFSILLQRKENVSLHLIGRDDKDSYSEKIREFIVNNKLVEKVFLYGEQGNIESLLSQMNLAVLASFSEGLPVALLEYGKAGLPVVCTSVGDVPAVIGAHGILVPPKNSKALSQALLFYLNNNEKRSIDAENFNKKVTSDFSEVTVIKDVINFYERVLY